MEYLSTLDNIFNSLRDLGTISGLEVVLNEKNSARLISLRTNRQTNIEIRKEGENRVAYLLQEKLVNYPQKIDEFFQHLFDYLNHSQPEMRNAIFEMVHEKINSFRLNLPSTSNDYHILRNDIALVIEKEELDSGFDLDSIYEILTKRREIERDKLIDLIEEKMLDLEDNISLSSQTSIRFRSQEQRLAWLYELGILDTVLQKCKIDGTYNWTMAADIIVNIMPDYLKSHTTRKALMAIFQESYDQKFNPTKRPINQKFVAEQKARHGMK